MSASCQEKAQTAVAEMREEKGLPPLDETAREAPQRPTRRSHRATKWKRKKFTGKKKASTSAKTPQETNTKRLFIGFFVVALGGLGVLYYQQFNKMVQQGKIGGARKKGKKKKM